MGAFHFCVRLAGGEVAPLCPWLAGGAKKSAIWAHSAGHNAWTEHAPRVTCRVNVGLMGDTRDAHETRVMTARCGQGAFDSAVMQN